MDVEKDQLKIFIHQLLDEKQLNGVTPEVRKQLVADIEERLTDQINRAVIDALSDEQVDQLSNLTEQDGTTDTIIENFIANCGVDVQSIASQTMLRFRDHYLGK